VKHYPMTKEQRELLDQDLATVMKNLGNMAMLLNACYGDMDPSVARAAEAHAAVQRLVWAVERQGQPTRVQGQSPVSASPTSKGRFPTSLGLSER
jgi:hypothetical protein